jgi:hypothetical protein
MSYLIGIVNQDEKAEITLSVVKLRPPDGCIDVFVRSGGNAFAGDTPLGHFNQCVVAFVYTATSYPDIGDILEWVASHEV